MKFKLKAFDDNIKLTEMRFQFSCYLLSQDCELCFVILCNLRSKGVDLLITDWGRLIAVQCIFLISNKKCHNFN